MRMFCRVSAKTFVKNRSEIDGRAYNRQCCDAVVRRETYDRVLVSESFDPIAEVSVLGRVFRARRDRFTTIETAKAPRNAIRYPRWKSKMYNEMKTLRKTATYRRGSERKE